MNSRILGIPPCAWAFRRSMKALVAGISLLCACAHAPETQPTLVAAVTRADPSLRLRRQLAELEAGGTFAFAARHVESGRQVSLHGDRPMPMQSVFKVPLALAVLARVDAGTERLDATVPVHSADLRAGPTPAPTEPRADQTYAVRELLGMSIQRSDNTATDLLLARVAGPAGVTSNLRARGLTGIDVSRSEGALILEAHGLPYTEATAQRDVTDRLIAALSPEVRRAASAAYLADPRDTATADAMVTLLARLQKGELLSVSSTALLLEIMAGTKTGAARLRAGLPDDAKLAHKTGTSDSFENVRDALGDVGIVTLPNGEHLALAGFVSRATFGDDQAERAIADAARLAYAAFTEPP